MEPIAKFYIQDQKIWRSITTCTLLTNKYHVIGAASQIDKFAKIYVGHRGCSVCNKFARIKISVNNINELLCTQSEHYEGKFPAIETEPGVYRIEIRVFLSRATNIIIDTLHNNFTIEKELCNINQVVNYQSNIIELRCEICNNYDFCNCKRLIVPFIINRLSNYKLLLTTLICDDVAAKIVIMWYNLV